jgi:arylsulfatase A-like enzyme
MSKPTAVLAFFSLLMWGPVETLTADDNQPIEPGESRPNILFIAVDDLKPLTGEYGNQKVITPALDKLASQSVVFTRAYTAYPVCGPSRTSLLTGVRPESNGVIDLKTRMRDVNPDILTLPQHFKNHGYQTAAVGKIFDPRNVDSRDDDDPASWSIPFQKPVSVADKKGKLNLAVRSIDAPPREFVDGNINERGISLLRKMARDTKPFFLAVGYKKPHLPFAVPSTFFELYQRASFELEPFQQRRRLHHEQQQ